MIGEIRDRETAQIAFRASVTGHLVLSTVHTNDAAGAVTRLVDLGLEPYMVASSLIGVVSMRLVRVICPRCKVEQPVDAAMISRLGGTLGVDPHVKIYRGAGCPACRQTGYTGRTGIYEVLEVSDSMRTHIARGMSEGEVRDRAVQGGMRPIGEDGLEKAMRGNTTLEEVMRVVYLPEQGVKLCSSCNTVVSAEFEYCHGCGHYVGEHCSGCSRRMEEDWTFCPTCGAAAKRSAADRSVRELGHGGVKKRSEPADSPSGPLRRAS
jgi:RNA polymerase subunit RPABC4/transcription elongation factor Spt4